MRSICGILVSGVLASVAAGCTLVDDYRYYHAGIGSDLYAPETVAASANLDAYIGLLCVQAGLPRLVSADGTVSCTIDNSPSSWALVVQAGMNDIDGRCDAYLAWLDDKRRSNEPFLKQLAATSAATLGILDATSASVKAITITGIAFGLAANTFTNFNARILSLEQSTVQSVVVDSQQKYRENNSPLLVQSRPAAVYYLRNYLRICLPFTIETAVNNTAIVFHRAGAGALTSDTLFTRPVIVDPTKPLPRRPLRIVGLKPADLALLSKFACVTAPASANDLVAAALAKLAALGRKDASPPLNQIDVQDIKDELRSIRDRRKPDPCPGIPLPI